MFHAKDRFYFHRNPDGSVLVRAVVNEKVTHETTLDDRWLRKAPCLLVFPSAMCWLLPER
jgi:hypothetical protein